MVILLAPFFSRQWVGCWRRLSCFVAFSCWLLGSMGLAGCQSDTDKLVAANRLAHPAPGVIPVRIVRRATGTYELQRGGRPYLIKGAAGVQRLHLIKAKGGNSVRIYTANYADVLLDEAQRQGITVMFGLWMKPPYEKFDYYDPKAVAEQQREVYRQVLRYRNHPALLMWNLGNELDNSYFDFKVYQVVNETVRMIHQLDPYHPVTTTVTDGTYAIPALARLCPDLDLLTVNIFGNLPALPTRLSGAGWPGPYIIGEFGGKGWWEAPQTSWGAPLDESNSAKATFMATGYRATVLGDRAHCLGSYVIYWGNRFEQTDMWLSMFGPKGEKTPLVDVMEHLWTGRAVANRAPDVGHISLAMQADTASIVLRPATDYPATISAHDPDGDSLRVEWRVIRDVDEFKTLPQNRTAPERLAGVIYAARGLRAQVRTPTIRGSYRLLVDVYDGHGSMSSNSLPFFVDTPGHPQVQLKNTRW